MSQYVETPCRTFIAGGAIDQFLRTKMSGGKLAVAGAEEKGPGTIEIPALADRDPCPVRLWNANGTRKMVAAGAFAAFAELYGAAAGRVDDAVNSLPIGLSMEASNAAGDIIEVLPMSLGAQGS